MSVFPYTLKAQCTVIVPHNNIFQLRVADLQVDAATLDLIPDRLQHYHFPRFSV